MFPSRSLLLYLPIIYAQIGNQPQHCSTRFNTNSAVPCQQANSRLSQYQCNQYPGCCWHLRSRKCYANNNKNVNSVKSNVGSLIGGLGLNMFDSNRGRQLGSLGMNGARGRMSGMGSNNALFNFMGLGGFGGSYNPLAMNNNQLSWLGYQQPGLGIGNLPVCPVNVPLCYRDPCLSSQVDGNNELDQNAYACYSQKGCCFDLNLFLYKQFFGVYKNTPTCYRAVKSNLYYQYTSNIIPWYPEFSELVAGKMKLFDEQDGTAWARVDQCPQDPMVLMSMSGRIFNRFLQALGFGNGMVGLGNSMFGNNGMTGSLNGFGGYGVILSMMNSQKDMDGAIKQVIDRLSGSCGWDGITRFECQMWGCCWNRETLRCTKKVKLDELQGNDLVRVMMDVLGEEDEEQNSKTSKSWFGGGMNSLNPFAGLGMGLGGGNNFGLNMFGGNSMGGLNNGMNGWGQNNDGNNGNTFAFDAQNLLLQQALLGGSNNDDDGVDDSENETGSNPDFNQEEDADEEISFVDTLLQNTLDNQIAQQVQGHANQRNSAQCNEVNHKRRCAENTGNIMNDLTHCQSRGCCFDSFSWQQEGKTEGLSPSYLLNFLSMGNGNSNMNSNGMGMGMGSGNFWTGNNMNNNNNMFGFGNSFSNNRFSNNRFQRSSSSWWNSNNNNNDFLDGLIPGLPGYCEWKNPYDGFNGFESLKSVTEQCCVKKPGCFHNVEEIFVDPSSQVNNWGNQNGNQQNNQNNGNQGNWNQNQNQNNNNMNQNQNNGNNNYGNNNNQPSNNNYNNGYNSFNNNNNNNGGRIF